jgi:hypothetical protein
VKSFFELIKEGDFRHGYAGFTANTGEKADERRE